MDITTIQANIKTKDELSAYKEKVLGQYGKQAEGLATQATQLAGLTNPSTFIATFISMIAPLAVKVEEQIQENVQAVGDLNTAFDDKENSLES